MSERPEPTENPDGETDAPTPDEAPESAIPATYRRAPRSERFVITGVVIGLIVGLALGIVLPAGTGIGRGTAAILLGIAGALAGGLLAGTQVATLEYMSGRSADRQRAAIERQRAADEGDNDGSR